jgi:hypothetical protein
VAAKEDSAIAEQSPCGGRLDGPATNCTIFDGGIKLLEGALCEAPRNITCHPVVCVGFPAAPRTA